MKIREIITTIIDTLFYAYVIAIVSFIIFVIAAYGYKL